MLLGLSSWVMGMVQLMSRHWDLSRVLTSADRVGGAGTEEQGGGTVLSLGGPILAGSLRLAGEMLWRFTVNFQGSHLLRGKTPSCPTGAPSAEALTGAWGCYLGFLHARSEMAGTCCSTAEGNAGPGAGTCTLYLQLSPAPSAGTGLAPASAPTLPAGKSCLHLPISINTSVSEPASSG